MNIEDILFAKALVARGSGNPNRVEVIEGTLDTAFGNMSLTELEELHSAVDNGNASAIITMDLSSIMGGDYYLPLPLICGGAGENFSIEYSYISNSEIASLYACWWLRYDDSRPYLFTFEDAYQVSGRWEDSIEPQDITSYASLIPTTLTIYWHPMPSA